MIDPRIWAATPGMGRAPLLPDPAPVSSAVADPRRDILRLLGQATGNERVMPGDRPVGALVRPVGQMTQAQQIAEMTALGGFPHEGRALATRAPAAVAGGLATLGGVPAAGLATGMMAGAGVRSRQRELAGELTQGMAEAMERGSQARDQRDISVAAAPTAVDAYEAGRQAARGYRPEREQRGGGDTLGGGRGGRGSAGGSGGDVMSGGRF